MCKRFIYLVVALGLCLAPAAQAAKIIWVSDRYDEKVDGVPDDAAGPDFLTSQGYTVDYRAGASNGDGYWRMLDAAKIAELNAADLIIVSRCTDSGSYASDATEVAQWNGIKAPLILMSPYFSRSSRWIWYNNDTLREDGGTPTLRALDPHHPLFKGVGLDAQNQVDIYDQSIGSGTVSFYGLLDNGNGALIARTAVGDYSMMVEWQPGKPFYAGGAQTPAGRRMLFCGGTREGGGQGRGEFNLNDEGKKLLVNAIEYMIGNLVREPWVKAWLPSPADGTTNVSLPLFQWTKGDTAIFHNVYMGTTPELTEADLVYSRQPLAMYFAVGLTPGTKYYWRVDEVELNGTVHTGDVWSFTTASLVAFDPRPRDGAKWLDPSAVTLIWQGGQGALKHDVYFGTDQAAVAAGDASTFKSTEVASAYDVGLLAAGTTYYWRVDEILTDGTKRTGAVWSFTTLAPGGGIRGLYFANTSLSGLPVINRIDAQINFNWATVPTGLTANNLSVRWVGELDVPFSETYTFYPTTDDGVRLWVNDVPLLDLWANRRSATESKASIALVGGQRYPIVMEFYNATDTAIAELRWESPSIEKDLIPQAAFSPPLRASSPLPDNGADAVTQSPVLMWNAGEKAAQHEVYFGVDAAAVAAATPADAGLYRGRQAADVTSFDAGALAWNQTYYWRVDEVNDASADSPWKGSVWSFTTADFVIVDDFEGYDDAEGTDTRLYENWIDGYADQSSGSIVGNFDPPFAEQVIVHSGRQSLSMEYDNRNSPYFSEAYREFAPTQNWTLNGVDTLVLWVQGAPAPVAPVVETAGKMTVTGSGTDIWNNSDQFTYVYKTLSGDGSLIARVVSIGAGTNTWAKGGVMVRGSLDADSNHAMMVMSANTDGTAGNGASFQYRLDVAGASASNDSPTVVAPPYWVKIERVGGTVTGSHSANGQAWTVVGTPQFIATGSPAYIGLCVTSHAAGEYRTVEFDNVKATGASGAWATKEIGLARNSTQNLYVVVEDSAGKKAVATDPNAVNAATWTEVKVPLSDLPGVNMTKVKKMYIGVGDRENPAADGTGKIYIDDIRVTKPAPAQP
jgi:hypothetical protein